MVETGRFATKTLYHKNIRIRQSKGLKWDESGKFARVGYNPKK